jgi:hypothetical protein
VVLVASSVPSSSCCSRTKRPRRVMKSPVKRRRERYVAHDGRVRRVAGRPLFTPASSRRVRPRCPVPGSMGARVERRAEAISPKGKSHGEWSRKWISAHDLWGSGDKMTNVTERGALRLVVPVRGFCGYRSSST